MVSHIYLIDACGISNMNCLAVISFAISAIVPLEALNTSPPHFWENSWIQRNSQPVDTLQQGFMLLDNNISMQASVTYPSQSQSEPYLSIEDILRISSAGDNQPTSGHGVEVSAADTQALNWHHQNFDKLNTSPLANTNPSLPSPTAMMDTKTQTITTPKPKVKMTIAEIILAQVSHDSQHGSSSTPAESTNHRSDGCVFNGKWYKPLMEIEHGQYGDWCYGSYCNHESIIVHWDNHKCGTSPIPPSAMEVAQPVNPDPNSGCVYKGKWYAPGTDIDHSQNFGTCSGTYCDFQSNIQHWADRCLHTMAPPTQISVGHLQQLDLIKK